MLEYLTLGEFAVAALMALAALSAFVWGVAGGAFGNVEGVKQRVLEAEDDEPPRS
ncbi:MAG: cytochrome oxidase maturation protein, cbb3-type [Candidatus Rokubacteria bacterium 13_1_20CM_2_68_19]|nr:MAG: cytochrome oxidase maturation protein, cbb3-type [Candidatus Rokubacteria bacterium 13_2_20CM_2_64_8]OLC64674.1 MAG: cytochrome oxidase maturation protein, cbb3-type [Candidatus Rokubacteria bacterium 13_1_40CM_4_67_11]OLD30808.1 MAG: cytochrome oxidase maturation protein, cbb3-type [Candidatus Rokubacteria bacterium 13_1_40CM_2_68_13]OLD97234.1 MAG: cytochrome oxidase maturation protein, cbb3-type [Candidatus Rokubacteria bacterium 13_1_20CM_4_68_9]OLE42856.1 MAG: cytochrome oxidase ma